jgi:hypothetical protein
VNAIEMDRELTIAQMKYHQKGHAAALAVVAS